MTRALVTGANGFVGAVLVPALVARGFEVRAAVRSSGAVARFVDHGEVVVCGDLDAPIDWSPMLRDVDAVVHLAGIAHSDGVSDARYEQVNHRATAELAAAAREAGVRRFVYVSSIKAQSGASSDRVLTEDDEPRPDDAYGRSKLAAERAVAASGVPFTVLRPVVIYGPGVKGNLRSLARLAATPFPLPFGGLNNRRSLLAVENLVEAVVFSIENEQAVGETFVVADPRPVTLAEIVAAMRRGAGRRSMVVRVPGRWIEAGLRVLGREATWTRLGGAMVVEPGKLLRAGWSPTVTTADGLAALTRQRRP